LTNKNYISGKNFEGRFILNLIKSGKAIRGGRFYGSKGATDVWWVDRQGTHNEAQLKYSKIKPYISPQELAELQLFAESLRPQIFVFLVMKKSGEKEIITRITKIGS